MCIHEKYINPFTDFTDYGFKKIFGDEENTELLESLINDILGLEGEDKIAKITFKNGDVFQNLTNLQNIPQKLRGDIIEKAFEKAEFINLPKAEQDKYHKNLKVYRDLFNSFETADKQGHKRGLKEGIEQGKHKRNLEIVKNLLDVLDNETIALKTGLSVEEIERLR